jgi:hypothetical protein
MNDIDNLAQSFFIVLIVCSLMNDSYVVVNNLFNNTYIKKKVNYSNKIYKIAKNMIFNNYEKDEKGNIIINDIEEKLKKNKSSNNPFDSDNESIDEEDIIQDNIEDNIEDNIQDNTQDITQDITQDKNKDNIINKDASDLLNIKMTNITPEENKKKKEKNDSNKLIEILNEKHLISDGSIKACHDMGPQDLPKVIEVTKELIIPNKSTKISCDEEVKNIDIVISKKHKKNREKHIEEDIKYIKDIKEKKKKR